MAAAFTEEQYAIIGRLIDERVGQAIGMTEGRTAVSLREIRAEVVESLAVTTATSIEQAKERLSVCRPQRLCALMMMMW